MNDEEAPRFSHSLRGYDRVQVDEYLAQSSQQLIELEDRTVAAESALVECRHELASPGSAGISQRLAAILQLANEEADEHPARARAEADATTQAAAEEAERTVKEASAAARTHSTGDRRTSTGSARCCSSGWSSSVIRSAMPVSGSRETSPARRRRRAPTSSCSTRRLIEGEAAIDDEPPTEPGADTDVVTSTGLTPDPS